MHYTFNLDDYKHRLSYRLKLGSQIIEIYLSVFQVTLTRIQLKDHVTWYAVVIPILWVI